MNPLRAEEVNLVLFHSTATEATEVSTTDVFVCSHPSALSVHFSSCAFALEVDGKSCRVILAQGPATGASKDTES